MAKLPIISHFSCLLSINADGSSIRRVLLFADLDVFSKLFLGFVTRDFHDGDGWNTRQIHIRCSAAAGGVFFSKVAFLNNARLLLGFNIEPSFSICQGPKLDLPWSYDYHFGTY